MVYNDYLGDGVYKSENIEYQLSTVIGAKNNTPIALFSNKINESQTSKIRIYSAIFIENGIEMHHFIPVQRRSDNEIGMYDNISGNFFPNAGTDDFVMGPNKSCTGQSACPVGSYCTNGIKTTCPIGTYADTVAAKQCTQCTNAPANSEYTTGGITNENCPWTCAGNHVKTAVNTCGKLCTAGITTLNTSTGIKIPIFAEKNTTPSIHIQPENDAICYIDLIPGKTKNEIHILYNDVMYHTVKYPTTTENNNTPAT